MSVDRLHYGSTHCSIQTGIDRRANQTPRSNTSATPRARTRALRGCQRQGSQQIQALMQSSGSTVGPDAPQIGTMAGQQSGRALMMRQKTATSNRPRHRPPPPLEARRSARLVRGAPVLTTAKWLRVNDDAEDRFPLRRHQ
jgi:hypothetical protein